MSDGYNLPTTMALFWILIIGPLQLRLACFEGITCAQAQSHGDLFLLHQLFFKRACP